MPTIAELSTTFSTLDFDSDAWGVVELSGVTGKISTQNLRQALRTDQAPVWKYLASGAVTNGKFQPDSLSISETEEIIFSKSVIGGDWAPVIGTKLLLTDSLGQVTVFTVLGSSSSLTTITLSVSFDSTTADSWGGVYNVGFIPRAQTAAIIGLGNVPNVDATNASNLSTGTIPAGRFPSALPAINGSALTNLSAGALVGTIDNVAIGTTTRAAGRFTTLSANGAVDLSPANSTVSISPTGTGVLALGSGGLGTMDHVTIGGTTPAAGSFTALGASGTVSLATSGAITLTSGSVGSINNMTIGATAPAAGAFTTIGATGTVTLSPSNANVVISPTGTGLVAISPSTAGSINNVNLGQSVPLAVGATTISGTGTLSLDSTSSGIQIYNTVDKTTNYERLEMYWGGNIARIRTVKNGTGNSRAIIITGPASFITFSDIVGTPAGQLRFGGVSSSTAGTIAYNFSDFASTATSGTNIAMLIAPTWNQTSGSGSNVVLRLKVTETALGSGAQYLIQALAGSSGSTQVFTVSNAGLTSVTGLRITSPTVPGSASAAGTAGDIAWDSSYLYVCTSTNAWKRTPLSTW